MSGRRLSSQQVYEIKVDDVSTPAMLIRESQYWYTPPTYKHAQMTHVLGDDIFLRQKLPRRQTVLQKTLD